MLDKYYILIEKLTNDFSNCLEEDSQKNELVESFKKYLEKRTISLSKPSVVQVDTDKFIEKRLVGITKELMELTCEQKKSFLLKDEAFERLRDLSMKLFNYASKKKNNESLKLTRESYYEILVSFDKLFELVKPYNKQRAEKLRSEGILDAEYLLNDDINIMSIRLYHL